MAKFTLYTADHAPEAAKPSLKAAKAAFGLIPNLQATMAESPELLAGYTALWDLFAKTTLTSHEQQVVYLTANFENECRYCMAGHTALAKMQKMVPAVINALRNGTEVPDRKLEALRRFAALVVRNRGWVSDADTDAFLAGYTRRNVLEVILDCRDQGHEQLHQPHRSHSTRPLHARPSGRTGPKAGGLNYPR
jgi:AhpD family alkylhydroperoxidase